MDSPTSGGSDIIVSDLEGSDVHGEQLTDDSCGSDGFLGDVGDAPADEASRPLEPSEGFTREGLMRAGHPLNPFYLPFDPDAKPLASTVHVQRLCSYPQFWNHNKLRAFTDLLTGPDLFLRRYGNIAKHLKYRFARYRPMSGLDIEHRCVILDDVGRNRKGTCGAHGDR